VRGLHVSAESLEELVLDNNQLESIELGTVFPKLHTLSLNKNRVKVPLSNSYFTYLHASESDFHS
jgi:Leucine-rich repeat (LRR) protein